MIQVRRIIFNCIYRQLACQFNIMPYNVRTEVEFRQRVTVENIIDSHIWDKIDHKVMMEFINGTN